MGQTIQIYMPNDEPRGVRVASVTTRIVQALVIPRRRLNEALTRPEAAHVAVYFLFGEADEGTQPLAYIGETEDVPTRMRDHNVRKDFWNSAVVVVAEARFTKAHVKYLEWHCVSEAARAGRYALDNSNRPTEPFLPEPQIADCLDAFATIDTLLSALGFPLFEPTRARPSESTPVFFCRRGGVKARGELRDDGFVVLSGSHALRAEVPSASPTVVKWRRRLIADQVLREVEDVYEFTRDYLFPSPSAAAVAVIGGNVNGWNEWRDDAGRTLDEVYRQATAEDADDDA